MKDMAQSKFNLAPRGYGRSSFRFAELVAIVGWLGSWIAPCVFMFYR